MSFGGSHTRLKSPCIICREREGTVRTRDGMVCPSCMPLEFSEYAERVSADQIIIYHRIHSNWKSCASKEEPTVGDTVSPDRSMAITLADSIVLSDELNFQIRTAESIDMIVSFILMSGLNLLMDSLREFTRNGKLRIITTSYMGNTEYECLQELFNLPNTEVRMELDAARSRIHAKSYIFNRTGKSTAYVGSANLSKTALTSGEEWVVKLREQDVPQVIDDLRKGFDDLWESGRVRPVDSSDRAEIETSLETHGL